MEKLNFVFQTDSPVIDYAYKNNPNYLIEYSSAVKHIDTQYCIIYFSSHNIYFPNNEDTFKKQILVKNKYEWYRTRIEKGSKHIFIRDIQKQWYLKGINHKLNSIEKLYDFLKAETKKFKVITVGSSAGGFAAVLLGSMLNAETIFTFNGRFFFKELLRRSSESVCPVVFREKDNPNINKYYCLKPFIINAQNVFYFYSDRSANDNIQFEYVSDLNLHVIRFRTKHHGIPFLKSTLNHVINFPVPELEKLSKKRQYPLAFSIKIEGLYETFASLSKQLISIYSQRLSG